MSSVTGLHTLLAEYQQRLNLILTPIIPDNSFRFKMLESNAMKIWIKAITHESMNPADNYEDLEIRGDYVLKTAFSEYILHRFKNIDKETLTNMNHFYMSTEFESKLCKQIGIDKFIQSVERTTKIQEDVIEAFFGALFQITEELSNVGQAYVNCYNLVIDMFKAEKISIETLAAPKTFIDQSLRRLGFQPVYVEWYDRDSPDPLESPAPGSDGRYRIKFYISEYVQNNLAANGFVVTTAYEMVTAGSKKSAEKKAYQEMYNVWIKAGLTREIIQTISKNNKWLGSPELKELGPRLVHKVAEELGYYNRLYQEEDAPNKEKFENFNKIYDMKFEAPSNMGDSRHGFISLILFKRDGSERRDMGTESYQIDMKDRKQTYLNEINARIKLVEKNLNK